MKRKAKRIGFCILLLLITGCAGTYQPHHVKTAEEQLALQLDRHISIPELETALVGVMVQSAKTGEILYQHNANTLMMPASNEKIPTSAAALLNFGTEFRYETRIFTTGVVEDSTLKGDLVIIGSGDPTIGYRFCENEDSCYVFRSWADSLKAKGIHRIEGDIIGVDDIFDDEHIGYGWTVDNLPYSYAAEISGLNFNENYLRVRIQTDSLGKEIHFATEPAIDYVTIEVNLDIDEQDTDIEFDRAVNTNIITASGKIKPGDSVSQRMSIHNSTLYFSAAFKQELENLGIPVTGNSLDADDLEEKIDTTKCSYLFSHFSMPFSEVLKILMKESQNLYAENMIKLMGTHFGESGTFSEGKKVLHQTLQRFGLEDESYRFMDGSGLGRYNYISPAHIVNIFRRMYYHPFGQIYRDLLPVAGVDGTIGYRMKGTIAQGKVFAKTGTISNVRCLSGYAISADGEPLVFSTMFNNFLCSVQVVMNVQDQICMLLTSFSRN